MKSPLVNPCSVPCQAVFLHPDRLFSCIFYPMLKDIPVKEVKDVAIAILPQLIDSEAPTWEVYLINLKNKPITNVLISSKGYGELDGEETRTSTLRHFFDQVEPFSYRKVEHIQTKVFPLHNEFLLSFTHDNHLFDKKYTFVGGSIREDNFTDVPLLNRRGVMIE